MDIMEGDWDCSIIHISLVANKVADTFAGWSSHNDEGAMERPFPPNNILTALGFDLAYIR